jgi:hypothetical protein
MKEITPNIDEREAYVERAQDDLGDLYDVSQKLISQMRERREELDLIRAAIARCKPGEVPQGIIQTENDVAEQMYQIRRDLGHMYEAADSLTGELKAALDNESPFAPRPEPAKHSIGFGSNSGSHGDGGKREVGFRGGERKEKEAREEFPRAGF